MRGITTGFYLLPKISDGANEVKNNCIGIILVYGGKKQTLAARWKIGQW
jgi:hypothetical protein